MNNMEKSLQPTDTKKDGAEKDHEELGKTGSSVFYVIL